MAKEFTIVYQVDSLNKNQKAVAYCNFEDDKEKIKKYLSKAERQFGEIDSNIIKYISKQKINLHLLDGLSNDSVKELSKYLYHYVYAVCLDNNGNEEVLFISAFKDKAIKHKNTIKNSKIRINDREYNNPNYYVKELRLII